jgi:hypothetical protein
LAWRNAGANHGRSLLVLSLLAGAIFIIVAVAANTRDLSRLNTRDPHSGAGGYSLVAKSTVPLTYDLATPTGRTNLGLPSEDEPLLAACEIVSMLQSPGEDISCLNQSRPHTPRLLAMPEGFAESMLTGQRFGAQLSHAPQGPAIGCLGDADSVEWTLHSGLGKVYALNLAGQTVNLRFIGLLPGSIFAGELLVNEKDFRSLYPQIAQPSYFLIRTPAGQEQAVAEALRRDLGDLGLQVQTTGEVLGEFRRVQNTYLSMFLALGGLGLLLGTLGMVTVILRSVLERRRELGLLTALGFDQAQLSRLLLLEHGGLLVGGLLVGTVAALLAVSPQLIGAQAAINWPALLGTLLAVLAVGLLACLAAVRVALRENLLEGLRRE